MRENGMECRVKIEIFEGPLDLLLHLIRKNEIDIYDIPMALITGQYLEYLNLMQSLNLDVASEYLVMASTLVHIKSRMILPTPEEDEEEGEELDSSVDPRAELVQRLLEYQRYREAAGRLGDRPILYRDVFPRPCADPFPDEEEEVPTDPATATLFHLLDAFRRILSARQLDGGNLQFELQRISLADRIREISETLDEHPEGIGFEALFPSKGTRGQIVITFLALLEMVKLRMVRAYQATAYGSIRVVKSVFSNSPQG